jgi:hypothetical protein
MILSQGKKAQLATVVLMTYVWLCQLKGLAQPLWEH